MATIKKRPHLSVVLLYLVIFGASLRLTAEPPEGGSINDAIRKEDVAAVKRFIQGGADLNPNPEVTAPPLATAVRQGNLEIIHLLLDNGANPNSYLSEGPFTATPILFLVLDRGDKALVDLFLERGVSRDDFIGYLLASLSTGQHLNMARLILDRGLARIDSSLPFLLRYAVGTPETRALISSHSREITEGKANLLDEMLRNKGLSIVYGQHDPDLKLPLATAILGDKGDPFRYSAEKAFDGNVETSWVEGVKSDGIGQKIAFSPSSEFKESDISSIAVLPGYGAEKYFHRNNRVKQAILSVYPWGGMASQMNLSFGIGDRIYQTTLAFEDRMALQSFPLEIPEFEKDMVLSAMIFVLEITQVYHGSEWQDTCVAEIELRDRNGRKIPILP